MIQIRDLVATARATSPASSLPSVSGIYMIANTVNGRVYVGKAADMRTRCMAHRCLLNAGTHHAEQLQRDWQELGEEAFAFVAVTECGPSEASRIETDCIRQVLGEGCYNRNAHSTGRLPGLDNEVMSARAEIGMTAEQRAKFHRLGGASWLRERIDKAKEPKP